MNLTAAFFYIQLTPDDVFSSIYSFDLKIFFLKDLLKEFVLLKHSWFTMLC